MDRQELIEMLNEDLAEEHAAIIRYLIHAYQVGDDTPFGNMLLTTSREEMWHMNWLGDEIGEMGAEPNLVKADYPYDGATNATLLRSYIEYEDNLVPMYEAQAERVDSPELKRILQQLGWESLTHSRRFSAWLEKLGPAAEEPVEFEESNFTAAFATRLDGQVDQHYKMVLQHLRHAFLFEEKICPVGSELELTAFRHMKHMSYFAEELGERGYELEFEFPGVDRGDDVMAALEADLALTLDAREKLIFVNQLPEMARHEMLQLEVDNMISRNGLLINRVKGLMEEAEEAGEGTAPESAVEPTPEPDQERRDDSSPKFTIGNLKGS